MSERVNRRMRGVAVVAPLTAALALALSAGAAAAQSAAPTVDDIAAAVRARVGDVGISIGSGTTGAVTIGASETLPVTSGGAVTADGGRSVALGDSLGHSGE
ncbi:MAG: hypothetical protein IT337_08530 [Thermomicrobiales bacterium]|nr:hypothetical protein [Thermomicrobiales bacterium]